MKEWVEMLDYTNAFVWRQNSYYIADAMNTIERNPTTATVQEQAELRLGVGADGVYVHQTTDAPAAFAMWKGDVTLIAWYGCKTIAMAIGIIAGWEQTDGEVVESGVNNVGTAWANRVVDPMFAAGMTLGGHVFLAGHSGGSLAAMSMAYMLDHSDVKRDIRVVTFGSPKDSVSRAGAVFAGMDVRRFVNVGDTVAAMPPHPSQAFGFQLVMSLRQRQSYSKWGFATNGVGLTADKKITFNEDTFVTSPTDTLSLLGYFAGLDIEPPVTHAIAEYRERLFGVLVSLAQFEPAVIPADGPQRPRLRVDPPAEPGQRIIQQQRDAEAERNQGGQQNIVDPTASRIAVAAIAAGSLVKYRAKKFNAKWYVFWGAIIVYGPARKKICKRRAKYLNRLAVAPRL